MLGNDHGRVSDIFQARRLSICLSHYTLFLSSLSIHDECQVPTTSTVARFQAILGLYPPPTTLPQSLGGSMEQTPGEEYIRILLERLEERFENVDKFCWMGNKRLVGMIVRIFALVA